MREELLATGSYKESDPLIRELEAKIGYRH